MSATALLQSETEFIPNRILRRLPSIAGINVDLDSIDSEQRLLVETYIHEKFNARYAANVQHFLPYILTLKCNDNICSTVGIRLAESGPLYLEKYLQNPIEQEIGMHFKTAIQRKSIVEIGNLVSTWRGSSQLLFVFLTDLLFRIEREWVVFTATKDVEHLLQKMHFDLIPLGIASENMLGDDKDQWGSYYQDNPRLILGHIPDAMSRLKQSALMSYPLSLFSNKIEKLAERLNAGS